MVMSVIPTRPAQDQTFLVTLSGIQYKFTIKWIEASDDEGGWVLTINNTSDNSIIFENMPLTTGLELLRKIRYLNIPGFLVLDNFFPPDFNALGNGVELIYDTQ